MEEFDFSLLNDGGGLDPTTIMKETLAKEDAEVTGKETKDVNTDTVDVLDLLENNKGVEVKPTAENDVDGEENKAKDSSSKLKPTNDILFSLVLKSLYEEEVLSDFDEESFKKEVEELGSAQALVNIFAKEAELARQSARQEAEEDFKEYAALKDLGIDTKKAQELISAKIEFDSIKEDDLEKEDSVELRKEILIRNFKNTTKFSDDKIKKQVDLIVDAGKDVEEAKEALESIKGFNKEQIELAKQNKIAEETNKKAQRDALIKQYSEFIDKLEEPAPGVKINKQTKDKLKQKVLAGSIWDVRAKDPVKFDTMITYLVENGALDGKFDKVATKAKSSAIKELESVIETSKKTTGGFSVTDIDDDGTGLANTIARGLGVRK